MSELSRQARRAMRAKIHRITKGVSGKIDASDYGPEEVLNAGVKTGMRPISRRAYKKGGKVVAVEGKDAKQHAGKKPRGNGSKHLTVDALVNRNLKDANEGREGIKHVGALKTGGRATKQGGGPLSSMDGDLYGLRSVPVKSMATRAAGLKKGGRACRQNGGGLERLPTTPTAERDTMGSRELEMLRKSAAEDARKPIIPGRTSQLPTPPKPAPKPRKHGGKAHPDEPEDRALIGKMVKKSALKAKKHGGMALDGEYQGTRPTGGRIAKRDGGSLAGLEMNKGGRAKKSGKTNINIVIATGRGQPGAEQPPMPGRPPQGIPVAIPPAGGPGGMPPMPAGAPAPMPAPPMAPPMGGAPMPRKRGGRTYRSYKDMDAGAGSGLGRLEKTEIQKNKR